MPDIVDKNGVWTLQPDANFASFELEEVDLTDGTWTHIDIDNRISSIGFFDGATKVVTNVISAGTENQLAHSTGQNVPRWYKPLTDDNGVTLTTGDSFIFISTIQALSSSEPAAYGFGIGMSVNPIGTGSNYSQNCLQGQGQKQGWMFHSVTNEFASGVGRKHEYDSNINANGASNVANMLTSSVATYVMTFGNTNGAAGISFNNLDQRLSKPNSQIIPTTSSFFLQVGFGARQNSSAAASGAEHKQKIRFKVIRLNNS
jgi:hypothetical protein